MFLFQQRDRGKKYTVEVKAPLKCVKKKKSSYVTFLDPVWQAKLANIRSFLNLYLIILEK